MQPQLTRLGQYELIRPIGSGGMGVVYEGRHRTLGRRVAVKVLHARDAASELQVSRFLGEGRAAAQVRHPHVVDVFDFGVDDHVPYLVMELIEGETLAKRLEREGALPLTTLAELLLPVISAVAELHAAGIIHRDLKPANILLARERSGGICPKVADFGVSRMSDSPEMTESNVVLGTFAYMAPEQGRSSRAATEQSDQYALGVILYECATGSRPFTAGSTYDLLHAVMTAPVVAPSARNASLPPAFDALVLRALSREPDRRFGCADDLGATLLAFATPRVAERWTGEFQAPSSRIPAGAAPPPAPRLEASRSPVATTPAPVDVDPRAGPGATGPRPKAVATAAGMALLALLGAGVWRWAPRGAPAATAPPMSVSAAAPVPGLAGAIPSSNPEAQRLFEEAMRSFHDGTGQAVPLLEAAVKIDPGFAAASLRLWALVRDAVSVWVGGDRSDRVDEYHQRVLALQGMLSPQDRALLDCEEELDGSRANDMLDAYLARYPDDDLALVLRADGNLDTAQRAAAAAPTLVPILANEAWALDAAQREDEASAVIARCLQLSPQASDCLSVRVRVLDQKGECAAAEADARRWLALQPGARTAAPQLAGLLAAQGAPVTALREALGADTFSHYEGEIRPALIPMFEGDFAEVESVARDALARAHPGADVEGHYLPAATLVHAYTEAGDLAAAAAVAVDYLSRSAAWTRVDAPDMVAAAARGGRMDRAEANRRLDSLFAADLAADQDPETRSRKWLEVFGEPSESREEAVTALARLDAAGVSLPFYQMAITGRVLFLAGRGADARPRLEAVVRKCSRSFLDTRDWARSHLYLGELDERAGDVASACGHYAKILGLWGHATPRSVSADEARVHATKLGCTRGVR